MLIRKNPSRKRQIEVEMKANEARSEVHLVRNPAKYEDESLVVEKDDHGSHLGSFSVIHLVRYFAKYGDQ